MGAYMHMSVIYIFLTRSISLQLSKVRVGRKQRSTALGPISIFPHFVFLHKKQIVNNTKPKDYLQLIVRMERR